MAANVIATLIPCGDLAENICCLPHNLRLQPVPPRIGQKVAPRLQLTFREEPKVPQNGYSFGTNPQGDVLLGESGVSISRQHFCISFDSERNLVLNDTSQTGTRVTYGGEVHRRQHFTWILDIYKDDPRKSKDVMIKVGDLKFKIEVPNHDDCESEYKNNVENFLRKGYDRLPTLNALGIDSIKETAVAAPLFSKAKQFSKTKEFSKCPLYVKMGKIGMGAFGEVWMVINVSTGKKYARKKFFRNGLKREIWLKMVKEEIRIMKKYEHVSVASPLAKLELINWKKHVMPVEGKEGGDNPWLLMPYYPLGNLSDQSNEKQFTRKDIEDILFQILEVLDHLYPEVAHRDLKPENILVESRHPSISIRIADFGVAKVTEGTNLRTDKGTLFYMAPEISDDQIYSPSVDLWSAGVIVLKYAYGLPEKSNWGNWCQDIANHANEMDGGSDPLLNILQTGMLQLEPKKRLSARECFKRVKTDLFSNDNLGIRGATRAEGTALRCDVADKEGSITVTRGALQNKDTTRISYTILPRTAQQDNVVDDNGSPSHQDEGVFPGQKTSNLEDNGNLGSLHGEKDGKSNEKSAGHPIAQGGQAPVNKRNITTVSFPDSHRSKRRRKSIGATNPSRRLS